MAMVPRILKGRDPPSPEAPRERALGRSGEGGQGWGPGLESAGDMKPPAATGVRAEGYLRDAKGEVKHPEKTKSYDIQRIIEWQPGFAFRNALE
ncbi:hypothetical protein [Rhodospirillum rubrum]|uniref:hypothetical protein n=1 Tax=Rhodospirillum rubrum TaxID=1085 RepID=UPI00190872F2|nr:hypothetical protein [Rhodospirillum rubrum]